MSSSMDREQSHRDNSRVASVTPLSREASDVTLTPAVRKTDVRTETQPNGSEVTTTIVEFTDQVLFSMGDYAQGLFRSSDDSLVTILWCERQGHTCTRLYSCILKG